MFVISLEPTIGGSYREKTNAFVLDTKIQGCRIFYSNRQRVCHFVRSEDRRFVSRSLSFRGIIPWGKSIKVTQGNMVSDLKGFGVKKTWKHQKRGFVRRMQVPLAKRFCIRIDASMFLAKYFAVLIFGSFYQEKERRKNI